MDVSIAHQTDESRFLLAVDGEVAGYADYFDAEETRDFYHTVIEDKFRGQGLSSRLITAALDETRHDRKKVIPSCSAVRHFMDKHEEYQDLLA